MHTTIGTTETPITMLVLVTVSMCTGSQTLVKMSQTKVQRFEMRCPQQSMVGRCPPHLMLGWAAYVNNKIWVTV